MVTQRKKRKSFKSPRITEEQKQTIQDLYNTGVCPLQISKQMNITSKTVYIYLDKFGLRAFNGDNSVRRKYSVDNDYFANLDVNKIYWLGYLGAKAHSDNNYLLIEATNKDIEHLHRFLDAISSTYPVHHKVINGYIVYYVKIYSANLINDIRKHNLSQKKTGFLRWPVFDDEQIRHYMRGYFDGKGFWGIYPEKNVFIFSVRGQSQTFVNKFRETLRNNCGLNLTKTLAKTSCFAIQFSGRSQCKRIFDYLYTDTDIYLGRKYTEANLMFGNTESVLVD